ncbi:MAG: Uncharacterized protein Greene041619_535 [Candidatus Peregrinibacteria bacterium Greene0416_19]|nr:MAG: Uncharacterized protein Greene041619_535 [Candidatus Peregrinibacteria bacterium Greene0416_19]
MPIDPSLPFSTGKTATVLVAVLLLAGLDVLCRVRNRNWHLAFAAVLGTLLSLGFITVTRELFSQRFADSPHLMAFGVVLLLIGWRFLFGGWQTQTKAAVLGTALFWIMLQMLVRESAADRTAHLIAIAVALVPAGVWCALFLSYHRERVSAVLLLFFAGILSTAPILFYDALVRHKVELQFFFFRVVPESFNASAHSFVNGQLQGVSEVQTTLVALFLSFLCVGFIEEGSKYWVLSRAGGRIFESIDDVMQLAIVTAIGFAFAENVSQSGYFVNFIREYLLKPERDWGGFLGNVTGRAILTNMVHIVSTGIMGYFLGLAIFAGPRLREAEELGRRYRVLEYLHDLLGFEKKSIFRIEMVLTGFAAAVLLHAISNFLVTLPDVLPGNPRTIGDLVGSGDGSPLHIISIILVPSLLYVVGGFWLLTWLFERKENMKRRGHLVPTDTYVVVEEIA